MANGRAPLRAHAAGPNFLNVGNAVSHVESDFASGRLGMLRGENAGKSIDLLTHLKNRIDNLVNVLELGAAHDRQENGSRASTRLADPAIGLESVGTNGIVDVYENESITSTIASSASKHDLGASTPQSVTTQPIAQTVATQTRTSRVEPAQVDVTGPGMQRETHRKDEPSPLHPQDDDLLTARAERRDVTPELAAFVRSFVQPEEQMVFLAPQTQVPVRATSVIRTAEDPPQPNKVTFTSTLNGYFDARSWPKGPGALATKTGYTNPQIE